MNVVVFEDELVDRLGALVLARPACDLNLGGTTLVEALARFGPVRRSVRPHLARHLRALAGARDAVWGGPSVAPPPAPPVSTHGAIVLLVNARVVPSRPNLLALRTLVDAGQRTVVRDGDACAAAVVHVSADGDGGDRPMVDAVLEEPAAATEVLAQLDRATGPVEFEMVAWPHDLLGAHERAIEGTLATVIDSGRYRELRPGLFVAPTATILEPVVVRQGPIVVDAGAEVGPFVCLDGPIRIGPGARVHPHAWVRQATSIGAACRVGGEIEATVLEPYANKPHEGFLGHSHVGSWVNLAAGTISGNLKATYGTIRLHEPDVAGVRATVDTGRQFVGALLGDFAKTAIGTRLPCGCRIGAAATVGGDVPESVPPLANLIVPGGSSTTAAQAATVLERMMARRGWRLLEADRDLLADVATIAARRACS
jgi:UDP-N-acetylglucosamine diphosphorylase/glucosamine-1-phosphate N-acetyltransferase